MYKSFFISRVEEPGGNLLRIISLVFVTLVCIPVGYTIYGAFLTGYPGAPETTLDTTALAAVYGSTRYFEATVNSIIIGFWTATLSTLIGGTIAWFVARTDLPGKKVIDSLMLGAICIAPVLSTMAWLALLAPRSGFLNAWSFSLVGSELIDLYSMVGIVGVMTTYYVSFGYLFNVGSFTALSSEEEEAARIHGAGILGTVWQVTIPAVRSSLLGGWVLIFAISAQTFAVPSILGDPAGIKTVAAAIYRGIAVGGTSPGEITSLGTLLLWPALLAFVLHFRSTKGARDVVLFARAARQGLVQLGSWRIFFVVVIAIYLVVTVLLPLSALTLTSFLRFRTPNLTWQLFTVEHYTIIFSSYSFQRALMNTLQIALWTACLGTVAALLLAYAICYSRSLTARLAEIVAVLPVAVPHMVMALGFLWAVTGIEYWRENPGTLSVMIVAIMTAYIGIGVRTMLSTMVQIPQVLDEAARVSGASLLVRLVRIIGPVILPTVVSVWRIFFILAILEISIVVLLYRSESVTISVMTFLRVYETGTAAAFPLGVLQLGMVLAAVLLTSFLNFCLRRMQTPAMLNAR